MNDRTQHFDTIVVGGGQSGLAVGYYLAKQGRSFVILDAASRIGDAWRNRWDSLRLFTPAKYSGLPGWRFPATRWTFPTKDEMADYLEAYAKRFDLPVRNEVHVDGVTMRDGRYVVTAGEQTFVGDNVVVATGANKKAKVPGFASELDPNIVQLTAAQYRNPSQLREGDVLIVGAGNSGAEISFELSRTHRVLLSGRDVGQIPIRHGNRLPTRLALPVVRFVGQHVLTMRTPIGRKGMKKMQGHGDPLVRVQRKDIAAAGIERVARTAGAANGAPLLEDGRIPDVSNVIWCAGFRPDFGWIDLPIFGEDGHPLYTRGVVERAPGFYFTGMHFQFSATSGVLPSRMRDERYVAKHIASHRGNGSRSDAGADRTREMSGSR